MKKKSKIVELFCILYFLNFFLAKGLNNYEELVMRCNAGMIVSRHTYIHFESPMNDVHLNEAKGN